MPEIIDLLSSSPPQLPRKATTLPANKAGVRENLFSLDSDFFDTTGDLEFEVEQIPKRRRLSPSSFLDDNPNLSDAGNDVFELSTESGFLPDSNRRTDANIIPTAEIRALDVDRDKIFEFSSSAPEPSTKQSTTKQRSMIVLDLSSDNEPMQDDPIQSSSQPNAGSRPVFSERTTNLLAGLRDSDKHKLEKRGSSSRAGRSKSNDAELNTMSRFKKVTKPSALTKDDIIDSPQVDAMKKSQKATSKAASKAERDAQKELEKEHKRKDKEQKALEKQRAADIAEVNKSKTNKKNSTPEMMIDMPASLQGLSVGNQVEEYMKQLDVSITFSNESEVDLSSENEVALGNIIRWRRKVTADYDEDLEIWKPLPQPRVTRENHVLIYFKAEEFVSLAVAGNGARSAASGSTVSESTLKGNLDWHVNSLRSRYPNNTIVYLIEGLSAWNRKSQTVKNRAYTAAVRSQILEDDASDVVPASSQPISRRVNAKKKKSNKPQVDLPGITPDITETLLLHLQLCHQPLLIQHTTSVATTASQISILTQHLSTRPYRRAEQSHNLSSASFCMTVGQIRTGATPHETYINMLQEINRVTPSMAYGISSAGYRNVIQLTQGFREHGNLMLEDVRKSVNKDGAWSDRRLGPMVSKRLYKVFLGRDPGARDGIA